MRGSQRNVHLQTPTTKTPRCRLLTPDCLSPPPYHFRHSLPILPLFLESPRSTLKWQRVAHRLGESHSAPFAKDTASSCRNPFVHTKNSLTSSSWVRNSRSRNATLCCVASSSSARKRFLTAASAGTRIANIAASRVNSPTTTSP